MYGVTDDFLQQSTKDHNIIARVHVMDGEGVAYTLDSVFSGSVQSNHGDAILRNFDTELMVTSDLTIDQVDELLQPAGTEVRPEIGFAFGGNDLYVPQGVYEIESYRATEDDNGVAVRIAGYDRAFTAQKPALTPYSVRGGTSGGTALAALVRSMAPRADFIGDTAWTAPSLFFPADTDRWAEAQKLAKSFGCDLGFDLDGNAQLDDYTSLEKQDPVWAFREGEDGCTFTAIAKEVQTDHLRTGVIVIGTHSSLRTEVRGEAWDMRPHSPTYRYGPLGERPHRVYSELPTSTGQANVMAQKLLSGILAGSDLVEFMCPIIPALELSDIIDVYWPRCRINSRYMVKSIDLPFDGTQMRVQASRGSLLWDH